MRKLITFTLTDRNHYQNLTKLPLHAMYALSLNARTSSRSFTRIIQSQDVLTFAYYP